MRKLFLPLYHIIHVLFLPIYTIFLLIRLYSNKESKLSFAQRFACAQVPKANGPLIWMHAASLGEAGVALTLIDLLQNYYKQPINYLITTGTLNSGRVLQKNLPKNTQHQFLPMDNCFAVQRFLNHHKPNLSFFLEEELWPYILRATSEVCPLILINGRISNHSFMKWQKNKWLFQMMMENFSKILLQSQHDLEKYTELGIKNCINIGNLKLAQKKPIYDNQLFEQLNKSKAARKLVCFASTHHQDEQAILHFASSYKKIERKNDVLIVLLLRHPARCKEVQSTLLGHGFTVSVFLEKTPLPVSADFLIVDSFGKVGLFYALADISIIGGSFGDLGGHNLLEAAHFNAPIIVGPDMSNVQDITAEMLSINAVIQVKDQIELSDVLFNLLEDSANSTTLATQMSDAALNYVQSKEKIGAEILEHLDYYVTNITQH